MKITYLKLVNFIGIYDGLGRTTIEINFSKGSNKIVMLNGQNGSGKTTILSTLNPYRETFDGRSDIILEGKDGLKEIHYEDNDHKYIIVHSYGRKNKSYISCDGKELNENGNIRPCYNLIDEQLGVTKDYFTIGRLGDNVSNFINLKKAQRKDYINMFVPDITEYLSAYDVTNNKSKQMRKSLDSINGELSQYEELSVLKDNFDSITKNIDEREKEIQQSYSNLGSIHKQIDDTTKELEKNDLNSVIPDNVDINDPIAYIHSAIDISLKRIDQNNKIFDEYPMLKDISTDDLVEKNSNIRSDISNQRGIYQEKSSKLKEIKSYISNSKDKIFSIKEKMNSLTINDESKILDEIKNTKDTIKSTHKSISEVESFIYKNVNDENLNLYSSVINQFISLQKEFDDTKTDKVKKIGISKIDGYIEGLQNGINELGYQCQLLRQDYDKLINDPELLDILKRHPNECDMGDNCPFKNYLLKSGTEWSSIEDLENILNKKVDEYNHNSEEAKKLISELQSYSSSYKRLLSFVQNENNSKILDEVINIEVDPVNDYYEYIEKETNMSKRLDATKKYFAQNNILKEQLYHEKNMQLELDNCRNNKNQYDEYNNSLKSENDQLSKFEKESDIIQNDINDISQNIDRMNTQSNILSKVIDVNKDNKTNKEEVDYLTQTLDNNKTNLENLKKYQLSLSTVNNLINNQKIDKKTMEDRKYEINEKLVTVKKLHKSLNTINDVYKYYDLINEAVNPKKGIPLVFINAYLDNIRDEANKLLDIAYNGSFNIDFNLTAKEFAIPVFKDDGTSLKDITDASQGEVSLTNLSLSLSMLDRFGSKYNVFQLDEVDGVLSANNRRMFIDMLEKQTDYLGIDQIFVISHNDDFYASDLDLVLLNGYTVDKDDKDFMNNKTVLFDITDKPTVEKSKK